MRSSAAPTDAERNVVSGSQRHGIVLDASSGAHVLGNFVGTTTLAPCDSERYG